MEVLKKGRDQKGWTTKRTCTGNGNGGGGCRAKLLVSASDLYKTYHHSYDGSTDAYVTFTCPLCGVETDIENAPYEVSGNLPSKQKYFENKK
ncbi:MAG: hypothetical protein WC788_09770 [Candidatus Paceibacterota bacterium]|jgi:hypothetical protein